MTDLRVVEVYVSYQGEGPNAGKPTVFVRFAGCNFSCAGWPCDTQHAIDPRIYRKLQRSVDPGNLADEILGLGVQNVCLTGGEVWLQNEEALYAFLGGIKQGSDHKVNVECFTNGSLAWSGDCMPLVDNFILDWKLDGSGESDKYLNNEVFKENFVRMGVLDAIKFTIKDRTDYEQAKERTDTIRKVHGTFVPQVHAGVVWGAMETEELCKWMIEDRLPWNLNVQVHKFIWHPDKIGV